MSATLPAGPEFTLNRVRHQYTPVQDAEYSSLHNPRCSCGWHSSGYVKDWLALHYWDQHRAAIGQTGKAGER